MTTEVQIDFNRRIKASTVRHLCGDVSDMTLHRWLNNPDMGFPKPQYIGRRRYWREIDVINWLRGLEEKRERRQKE